MNLALRLVDGYYLVNREILSTDNQFQEILLNANVHKDYSG